MDYTIYILLAFVVILSVFSKKINSYLSRKTRSVLNIDDELVKKRQAENTLFQRDEETNSYKTGNYINPISFKPKFEKSLILLFFSFIIIGIAFTFIATKGDKSASNFFPLIFTIYGIVMLLIFYSTKYELEYSGLKVSSLFETFKVDYSDIVKIEKRKINYSFRHGTKGRIRAETCADTIFITSSKPIKRQKYVIMISPKNQDEFINKIKIKL